MSKIITFFYIFIVSLPQVVQSQGCCGTNSALVSAGHPQINQGTFLIQQGSNYNKTEKNDLYQGEATFGIDYGVTNNFSLSIKTSYQLINASQFRKGLFDTFDNVIDTIKADTTLKFNNHGFGDGTVGVQYIFITLNGYTRQELKAGLDIGIPWGISDKKTTVERASVTLPNKAQTGTGSYVLGAFVAYNKAIIMNRLAFSTAVSGKIKLEDRSGVKQGNTFNLMFSTIGGPFWKFKTLLSFNYSLFGVSVDEFGSRVAGTGGKRVDVIPALELDVSRHYKLSANVNMPLWRDIDQKEYGNNFAAGLQMLFYIPVFFQS